MILVASTVASWKCDGHELDWLRNAEAMREASPVPLEFFCAVQIDPDPHDARFPSATLRPRLADLDGEHWRFSLHDGWARDSRNRLIGITTGRNLIREYAVRDTQATHVLFLDTDVTPPADCIPKLLELDHPVVGGDVPSYCLSGPEVLGERTDWFDLETGQDGTCGLPRFPTFRVEEHWNTAGFLLVQRRVLEEVAWRWNPGQGVITDDPCFAQDVERAGFGKTWVRKDVIGYHPTLVPVEQRG